MKKAEAIYIIENYENLKKNCCRIVKNLNNFYLGIVNIKILPKNRLEVVTLDRNPFDYSNWISKYTICINWLNYSDEQLQRAFKVRNLIKHIYHKKLKTERAARLGD